VTQPGPSWDLFADLQLLLQFHFMRNALIAASLVAVLAGAAGFFVVLRGQTFAAHMLSQVGFPGAAAAVLAGTSPLAGLIVFCVAAAIGVGVLGRNVEAGHRTEAVAVATLLAFALGLGLLFFKLASGNAELIYSVLRGTILGITDADVLRVAALTLMGLAVLACIARPLLFASVDAGVAEARGVRVRVLGVIFLLVTALAIAAAVQIVGTLLIFALLVAPAACALRVTARPARALAASVLLSLAFTWVGLAAAYFSNQPAGFFISAIAFGTYVVTRLVGAFHPAARRMVAPRPAVAAAP